MESKEHQFLKKIAQVKLHYMGYQVIYPEVDVGYVNGILDVVGTRLDFKKVQTIGIEIKVSRSDFFGLKQKAVGAKGDRWEEKELGVNFRYFLTPPNLIKKSELYNGWGLMTFNGRRVKIEVEAPRKKADNNTALFYLARKAHRGFHLKNTKLMHEDGKWVNYKNVK